MDEKIEKLSEWAKADFGFKAGTAAELLEAYEAGDFEESAALLTRAFVWSGAPHPRLPQNYWAGVRDGFRDATPKRNDEAMEIIRAWLGFKPLRDLPLKINRLPPIAQTLTEDQVATWLAARGMTMIDTKELAALKRNGTSGPPPIDGETLRRISRY